MINSLLSKKKLLTDGKIDKWEYIDMMYDSHKLLFEYATLLDSSEISKIEIKDGLVIMTYKNSEVSLICPPGDKRIASFESLNFGKYEDDEMCLQMKLLEDCDTIFDIGANYGWYSATVANKLPHINCYSFEPIPTTYEFLKSNIKLNRASNVYPVGIGFSDREGAFDFFFSPENTVNASLENVADIDAINKINCTVSTVDKYVTENNLSVDFIKCDVEGAELLVFKGSINTLKSQKPIVFTEMLRKWSRKFDYHPNDMIHFFRKFDYKCFVIRSGMLSALERVNEDTKDTNFVFMHEIKHSILIKQLLIL